MLIALSLSLVSACASDKKDDYVEKSVSELYDEAMVKLQDKEYKSAGAAFDMVEQQHPYSSWATKSQLMSAYSYYKAKKYDDAEITLKRYVEIHPVSKDVPYAMYLIGVCYYEQISDVYRDQDITAKAMDAFNNLISRFPDSEYSRDARVKVELTIDHLAGKEMDIGRFYLKRKKYLSAINRFKSVVEKYQTTTHIPEALYRLTESYTAIGLFEEAQKSAAVLGYNYPGSDWYQMAFNFIKKDAFVSKDDVKQEHTWLGMKY